MKRLLIIVISCILSFTLMLSGCSSTPNSTKDEGAEETATSVEETNEQTPSDELATTEEPKDEEAVGESEKLEEPKDVGIVEESEELEEQEDEYAHCEQYLSNFQVLDGNGYTVIVDDSIKDNFTTLHQCALFTMKKAYAELGTMDMGVFGVYDNYENAFAYDSTWGDEIHVYEDNVSPERNHVKLAPYEIKYIKGE